MDFSDKVVLITGGSSGLGAATAIYLSKFSAKLALVGRKEKNLRTIAIYCEKSTGIRPLTIIADLTNDSDVERIISETIEHYGKLDVLINNAGILFVGGVKNFNMENYDTVMSTNMRSVYHLTSIATPHLIETKGCIINVSAANSSKPTPMALVYGMSKAALDYFTKTVALELSAEGVRVNSVNPGYMKTNLLKNIGLTDDQLEMYTKNVVGNIPLKKPIEQDHVASLIAYLASDKAQSVTGSCYVIDGGSLLR